MISQIKWHFTVLLLQILRLEWFQKSNEKHQTVNANLLVIIFVGIHFSVNDFWGTKSRKKFQRKFYFHRQMIDPERGRGGRHPARGKGGRLLGYGDNIDQTNEVIARDVTPVWQYFPVAYDFLTRLMGRVLRVVHDGKNEKGIGMISVRVLQSFMLSKAEKENKTIRLKWCLWNNILFPKFSWFNKFKILLF